MAELSAEDKAKLAALQGLIRDGRAIRVAELVGVQWPAPTNAVYYAADQVDEIYPELNLSPVEARLSANDGSPFREVVHESGLSDEEVDLDFWDGDGAISDLFELHGAGVRVEIFYYFPDVDLLLSVWWGHLQAPEEADEERFVATAAIGYRSSLLPLPRRAFFTGCQAVDGLLLSTQAEIDEGDCPRNMHIGGDVGVPGMEFHPCPRNSAQACIDHIGDSLSFLAFDTVVESIINKQTSGGTLYPISRGNESNLKRPLRVVIGRRVVRELDLLAYTPQTNTNHPDKGFVRVLYAICEGRVRSVTLCKVNDSLIGFEHLNTQRGAKRQGKTGFSPNVPNYSGTALFFGVYGQVDPSQYNASNLRGEATIEGLEDMRVYTSETVYSEEYTDSRAWALLRALTDKRWGQGYDFARFEIEADWIPLAEWGDQTVAFTGADGTVYTGTRTRFRGELSERNAQQQITDICLAGRFGVPFPHQGKMRIVPLSKVEIDDSIPVFSDYGDDRNIVRDDAGKSTLKRSIVKDDELPNRIVLTFDDEAHGNVERPLTFEDVEQQLRAGRAGGDTSRRVVEKKFSALGVTTIGEAGRLGNLLLDLGEFDEGGLQNNLRVTFDTFFAFTLDLHKYKVIKVVSRQLERYKEKSGRTFEYFRIRSITYGSNLIATISAQAYPVDYYEQLETVEGAPPLPILPTVGGGNEGGRTGGRPGGVGFDALEYRQDRVYFKLAQDSYAVT